jgi:hypothetical protein
VAAAEDDRMDAYVRGELRREARERFPEQRGPDTPSEGRVTHLLRQGDAKVFKRAIRK